jgi:DNA replication protein DnaC
MRSKAEEVSTVHPSLPSGADSPRPAAVKVAAEPRRSGTLTARSAGKESGREGRITGRDEEFRAREPVERFFRGGMNSSTRGKSSPEQLRPEIVKLTAEEIEGLLRRLNLACTRRIYADVANRAEKGQWSYRDFLAFLLAEEVAHRQQTRLVRFTRKAHFPFFRTIEEFDFQRQPVLRKSHLGSYLEADFVREGRSLIFYGKHGRGKTHLAVAIGYRAIQNGFETLCANAAELIEGLSNASKKGQLQQALFTYTHPHVLICDEIGYLTHGQDAANVLFHVVNDRYLKNRPTIFTTNKPLSAWGKVLHDEDLAAAILDRVLERGRFIHLEGPSGRTGHQLDGQENLPATPDGARISGIDRPQFPEPTCGRHYRPNTRASRRDLAFAALRDGGLGIRANETRHRSSRPWRVANRMRYRRQSNEVCKQRQNRAHIWTNVGSD